MTRAPRIEQAEHVIHGVLKIIWDDGYEGVVDLRPVIDRGKIFAFLQSSENFRKFTLAEYGRSIGWVSDNGDEIDFDSHNLRMKSENQAKLQKLVANMNY